MILLQYIFAMWEGFAYSRHRDFNLQKMAKHRRTQVIIVLSYVDAWTFWNVTFYKIFWVRETEQVTVLLKFGLEPVTHLYLNLLIRSLEEISSFWSYLKNFIFWLMLPVLHSNTIHFGISRKLAFEKKNIYIFFLVYQEKPRLCTIKYQCVPFPCDFLLCV